VNTADGQLTFGDTEPHAQEMFPYTLLLWFIGKKNVGFNQKSNAYHSAVLGLVGRYKRYTGLTISNPILSVIRFIYLRLLRKNPF
jgi:hypothetical protein